MVKVAGTWQTIPIWSEKIVVVNSPPKQCLVTLPASNIQMFFCDLDIRKCLSEYSNIRDIAIWSDRVINPLYIDLTRSESSERRKTYALATKIADSCRIQTECLKYSFKSPNDHESLISLASVRQVVLAIKILDDIVRKLLNSSRERMYSNIFVTPSNIRHIRLNPGNRIFETALHPTIWTL